MCCSRSGGSLRRTELCCASARVRSPGYTPTLWRDDKQFGVTTTAQLPHTVLCVFVHLRVRHKSNPGAKMLSGNLEKQQPSVCVANSQRGMERMKSKCVLGLLSTKEFIFKVAEPEKQVRQTKAQEMPHCETTG